ncbi:MAG: hypothetical protein Q7K11_00430 [Candidatus Berkelbacteria bacterium]|nr:hypothetical protein [Candidatus Berkelbacteria bacterium]
MKHLWWLDLVFFVLLAVCATSVKARSDLDFPLEKGNTWIYRGPVEWTKQNSNQVEKKILEWKMEVVEVFQKPSLTIARIKGHPEDLIWYEKGTPRGEYLIIALENREYYIVSLIEPFKKEFINAFEVKDGELIDKSKTSRQFLELPLQKGSKFAIEKDRKDNMYCWRCDGVREKKSNKKEFLLTFETGPDCISFGFTPGIGISSYKYVHDGTVANCNLELIKFARK